MVESRPVSSAAATRSSPPAPSCHWGSVAEDEARFFLRLVEAASQAKVCTNLVQIADTDLDAEPFQEGCLHHTTWSAGRRVAVVLQPEPLVHSQFGWVPMSAILECSFPTAPHLAQQPIGRRTTDLDPGLGSSLLPPMTGLHEGNHLLFSCASLLRFHRSLLAQAVFTNRFSYPFRWERLRWRLPLSGDNHLAEVRLAEIRLVKTGPTKAASTEVSPAKICTAQLGPIELCSDQISMSKARMPQIGPAQVGPHEVGMSQVGPTQIGLTQIGVDLRMLSSPLIPGSDSLLENSEVLLICHGVSLLFSATLIIWLWRKPFKAILLGSAGSLPFPELHIWSGTQPVLASGAASRQVRSRFPTATTNRLPSGKRTAPSLTLRHTSSKSRTSVRLLKAENSSCTSLAVVVSHPPNLKKGNKRGPPQC